MSEPAKPGDLPTKTSYSALSTFLHCGRQYFLEKVQRVTRRPAYYFAGGSVAHKWTELYDTGLSLPDVNEMFLDAIAAEEEESGVAREDWASAGRKTKAKPEGEGQEWWEENLPLMTQRWVDWREKTGWEIWKTPAGELAVELDGEISLGDEVLRGHIDRVFVLPSKSREIIVPLDLKFGSREPDQSLQLGVYRAILLLQYGVNSRYGYYWMGRTGEHTKPITISPWTPALLGEMYRQFAVARENGIFLPNPAGHCRTCGVSRFCAVGGGGEAEGVDPLAELQEIPF